VTLSETLDWYRDLENDDEYWTESVKTDFAVSLHRLMQQQGINKSDLARRIGSSTAYMTKVLRGDSNLTIRSMVKLARAAGGDLHLHVAAHHCSVRWFEVVQQMDEDVAQHYAQVTVVNTELDQVKPEIGRNVWGRQTTKGSDGRTTAAA
jgi:transcriptional regulator with XRE-family HTH domain